MICANLLDKSATPSQDQVCVPETLLKKRKTLEKTDAEKVQATTLAAKEKRDIRKTIFKKADAYVKEYRQRENDDIRLRRQAKNKGHFYVPAQPKLLFVIRISGINDVHPKVKKVLQLFRLLQTNNGVFVRLNKATMSMLQVIEPHVTYGPPNLKTVRELIYKRGYAKVNGQRLPISDNQIISDHLKQFGIICVEDVIHEIFTVGSHFKQVNNFLWPFKLSNPNGHKKVSWKPRKFKHYVEGGDAGDREFDINKLVQSMN
ncbi:MAG: ribosomal protein L30, ferredoxin-like fold domain-containing protein [Benjaminiella poitrasii]|nr:MAG: ribosomal protein L30, ferredoxin-like fold domain-containing protein [Benjaminiella poitrasii]